MKYLLPSFISLLIIFSCSSPEKLLQQGDYDALINKSIKKIIKNPNSSADIELLDKAYNLANQRDMERANYLKAEGNPNTWDELVSVYSNLKYRQSNVRKVLPLNLHGRIIDYKYIDYDAFIIEAKHKAADYYYNHGIDLMKNSNKESYRQAYYEFRKAKDYSGGTFADIEKLIADSKYLGISRVLISVFNNTHIRFSNEFMDNLLSINTYGLNTEWIEYHFRAIDKKTVYDYYIDIKLLIVDVTPDIVNENDRLIKKKVEDGFTYVLDKKGNVLKDSLGNDIKVPKYKELSCTVIEKVKEKTVTLRGEMEYLSSSSRRLICKEPISASTRFYHKSARAIGDIEALDLETRNRLQIKELSFPDDLIMVYDTKEALKNAITDVIQHNKSYIK